MESFQENVYRYLENEFVIFDPFQEKEDFYHYSIVDTVLRILMTLETINKHLLAVFDYFELERKEHFQLHVLSLQIIHSS